MPVLRDGDQWIQDSDKIFEHLESKFPEPSLKPSDSAKQVYVVDALAWGSALTRLVRGAEGSEQRQLLQAYLRILFIG